MVADKSEDYFWTYKDAWVLQRNWSPDGYCWEYNEAYDAWVGYQKSPNSLRGTGWGVVMKHPLEKQLDP